MANSDVRVGQEYRGYIIYIRKLTGKIMYARVWKKGTRGRRDFTTLRGTRFSVLRHVVTCIRAGDDHMRFVMFGKYRSHTSGTVPPKLPDWMPVFSWRDRSHNEAMEALNRHEA